MPDEPSEELQRTVETLLATAERCYRLARGLTNQQAIEVLLRLTEECEQRAKGCGIAAGLSKTAQPFIVDARRVPPFGQLETSNNQAVGRLNSAGARRVQ